MSNNHVIVINRFSLIAFLLLIVLGAYFILSRSTVQSPDLGVTSTLAPEYDLQITSAKVTTYNEGDSFKLGVVALNSSALKAAEVKLEYDPRALEYIEATVNPLYLASPLSINKTTGRLEVDVVAIGSGFFTANPVLAEFSFKVKSVEKTSIIFKISPESTLGFPPTNLLVSYDSLSLPAEKLKVFSHVVTGNNVTVEAENYVNGGPGIGYQDLDSDFGTESYRIDAVDIKEDPLNSNGFAVGWLKLDEWLKYSVTLPISGEYNVHFKAATADVDRKFKFEVNGDSTFDIELPPGQTYDTYSTVTLPKLQLASGINSFRVISSTGYFDLDNFKLEYLPPKPLGCSGDYDMNGKVGISDFGQFARNYKVQDIDCKLDIVGGNCYLDVQDFAEFGNTYNSDICL